MSDVPPRDSAGAAAHELAERVAGAMLVADAFSRWMGVELLEVAPRRCVARMRVRADMVNGFGICHGGVTYAFADSVFAFACNSHGTVSVALGNSVSYPNPVQVGDVLTAVGEAALDPRRVGFYDVTVSNQRGECVLLFRGTSYDTRRPHEAAAQPP